MAKQVSKITVSVMANGTHYNFMQSALERAKAVAEKMSSS